MLKFSFLLCFLVELSFSTYSQTRSGEQLLKGLNPEEMPSISTREAVRQKDSTVYIRDTISGYKEINTSLTFLYIGGNYPNQILTVIIKGKETNKKLQLIRSGIGHFTGKIVSYKGKPAIIVIDTYQWGTRVMI